MTEKRRLFADELRARIKGSPAIVGIGNLLRGDDGLGPALIGKLKEKGIRAKLFDCGTAPENYIIPILSSSCDTVILIDAADMGIPPGEARIFGIDQISNVGFSTHNPSPRLFVDLLKTGRDDVNVFVLSVQPKGTALGEGLSEEVKAGLDSLTEIFRDVLA